MKTLYHITITALCLLAASSCTEPYDVEVKTGETRCIIYGELTTDTMAHRVSVTKSAEYFSNAPAEPISGANVNIWDGETLHTLSEDANNPGIYLTSENFYGEVGKTYTLTVDNVDLLGNGNTQSYSATSQIPPISAIDSIAAGKHKFFEGWEIKLYAQDPEETQDYYLFKCSLNNTLDTDTITNYQVTDDILFNGNKTNGIGVYFFEGYDALKTGDIIELEVCSIPKDFFKFVIEIQVSARPSVPLFSGPPANPRSNISNNAIGYFAAYSKIRKQTVVK